MHNLTSVCSCSLCICRCGLKGKLPASLGDLVNLEELQLFGNFFNGTLPSTLSKLSQLRLLSLGEYTGGNQFAPAPFPECIRQLTKLEALFLANCNMIGPIPEWIGALQDLRQLDLQRNGLSGPLPATISLCQNLLYLNVKDNGSLSGDLPIRELASLRKLNRLSLVHCGFSNVMEAVEQLQAQLPRCKIWT